MQRASKLPLIAGDIINDPDGVPHIALDEKALLARLAKDSSGVTMCYNSSPKTIIKAAGGEWIETSHDGGAKKENAGYYAEEGDAIFINPHDPGDVYVPGGPGHPRWQYDDLEAQHNYRKTGAFQDTEGREATKAICVKEFGFLIGAVDTAICIKNAGGEGNHRFYNIGDSLKLEESGRVKGVDKKAFDATWKPVSTRQQAEPHPARPAVKPFGRP